MYFLLSGHLSALHQPQHWVTALAIPAEGLEQAYPGGFPGSAFVAPQVRQQLGCCPLDTWALLAVRQCLVYTLISCIRHEGLTLGYRMYRTKIKPSSMTDQWETNLTAQPSRQKNDEAAQVLWFRIELFKMLAILLVLLEAMIFLPPPTILQCESCQFLGLRFTWILAV